MFILSKFKTVARFEGYLCWSSSAYNVLFEEKTMFHSQDI